MLRELIDARKHVSIMSGAVGFAQFVGETLCTTLHDINMISLDTSLPKIDLSTWHTHSTGRHIHPGN